MLREGKGQATLCFSVGVLKKKCAEDTRVLRASRAQGLQGVLGLEMFRASLASGLPRVQGLQGGQGLQGAHKPHGLVSAPAARADGGSGLVSGVIRGFLFLQQCHREPLHVYHSQLNHDVSEYKRWYFLWQ